MDSSFSFSNISNIYFDCPKQNLNNLVSGREKVKTSIFTRKKMENNGSTNKRKGIYLFYTFSLLYIISLETLIFTFARGSFYF